MPPDKKNKAPENVVKKQYPFKVDRYLVAFGKDLCSFSRITGLVKKKKEYMPFQEGGVNDYVRILAKPNDQYNTAIFEKGAGLRKFNLEVGSSPDILIFLQDERAQNKQVFALDETRIAAVEYSDLDAMAGGIMIERITVLYRGLREIPVNNEDSRKD